MTLQQQTKPVDRRKKQSWEEQDYSLTETLKILAEGSDTARELLNSLLSQYSWDGYLNELEFE